MALIICPAALGERYVYDATFESHPYDGNLWLQDAEEEVELVPVWGSNPALAPDGNRIAYSDFSDVYITDTNGSQERLAFEALPEWFGTPTSAWTSDGTLISDGGGAIAELTPSVGAAEWSRKVILDWKGSQYEPDISPDGTKIAFLSQYGPSEEWLPFGAIFVVDRDGENPVRVTYGVAPEELTAWGLAFSPNGESLAVEGYDYDDEQAEIYVVDIETGEFEAVTSDSYADGNPDWSDPGRIAFISEELGEFGQALASSLITIDSDGTDRETLAGPFEEGWYLGRISAPQPVELSPLTGQAAADALLPQFVPTLVYDDEEMFRALRADGAVSVYEGTELSESNYLRRGEGTSIASANPAITSPPLSLAYLDGLEEEYGVPGTETPAPTALGTDRISMRNSYGEDAAELQEDPEYADAVYGRAVYSGEQWWLQYWFFYYYNPWLEGFGDHEGDWEMIQVGLDTNGQPELVTYAQHKDETADQCVWEDVEISLGSYGNPSPRVYVADGSHASYLRPGSFVGDPPIDEADGDGYAASPYVIAMNPSAGWLEWPGIWGDSGSSPSGPAYQGDKWDDPAAFHAQAQNDCPTSGLRAAQRPLLGAPEVSAVLEEGEIKLDYEFEGSAPDGLRVAVSSSRTDITPTGAFSTIRAARGRTSVPLPNGPGPYTLLVRAIDKNGQRSDEVRRVLGAGQRDSRRGHPSKSLRKRLSDRGRGSLDISPSFPADAPSGRHALIRRAAKLIWSDPYRAVHMVAHLADRDPRARALIAVAADRLSREEPTPQVRGRSR